MTYEPQRSPAQPAAKYGVRTSMISHGNEINVRAPSPVVLTELSPGRVVCVCNWFCATCHGRESALHRVRDSRGRFTKDGRRDVRQSPWKKKYDASRSRRRA